MKRPINTISVAQAAILLLASHLPAHAVAQSSQLDVPVSQLSATYRQAGTETEVRCVIRTSGATDCAPNLRRPPQ